MPITCNAFAELAALEEQVGLPAGIQQTVACLGPKVVNLIDHELAPEQFMLLVINALAILAQNGAAPGSLTGALPCDIAQVLQNASCTEQFQTPVWGINPTQLQAIILYMLNQGLCSLV